VLLSVKTALDDELLKLRKEVAAAKKANIAQPDTHDYGDAMTRDKIIDTMFKEVD
jgi:type I restriction enzyme R subunit